MKILLTSDWYDSAVNGVVRSVQNLRRGLEARGHEVRVLTLSQNIHSHVSDGAICLGSVNAGMIYPGARVRVMLSKAPIRELLEWHPDVVHSNCEFSTFWMARYIAEHLEIPLVHTYHTVYENYTHYFSPSPKLGRQLVGHFSHWIAGRTDCIIAPTEKVAGLLRGYGIATPIRVLPTGIDLERFAPPETDGERNELRTALEIPENHTILLSLGRLAKEKNCQELLRLLAPFRGKNVTLVIVGDGPFRSALEQQTAELGLEGQVRFTGMVDPEQVGRYYQMGDLFVCASTSETQGLTYFEALASGLPMLCREDECLDGVVINGRNGWQYRTEEGFRQRLQHFLDHPEEHEAMAQSALETGQRYSVSAFAEGAEQIYWDCIQKRCRFPKGGICVNTQRPIVETMLHFLPFLGFAICGVLAVWGYQTGVLTSQQVMEEFVNGCGVWGPTLFVLLQIVQVVIPILPGGISCLAGVILFGPVKGFLYNYVGICVGSMLAFAVSKTYGRPLLYRLFPEKLIDRYDHWTEETGHFDRWFALAIFLPVAPDDFLCYLAGTTCMSWKKYTAIIWLCKPFAILAYSVLLGIAWDKILQWIQ